MAEALREIVIVGAGGFGKEILQYAEDFCAATPGYRVKGFLERDASRHGTRYRGYPVLGGEEDYALGARDVVLLALGTPQGKKRAAEILQKRGAAFLTLVHPRAYVAPSATVGTGSILCPFAYVGPDAVVEEFVLLNLYACCGHDVRIGRYAILGPYAATNGHAVVEEEVFLATHATVTVGRRVGRRSKISAGTVVSQDVPPNVLAAGNPATWRELYAPEMAWKGAG